MALAGTPLLCGLQGMGRMNRSGNDMNIAECCRLNLSPIANMSQTAQCAILLQLYAVIHFPQSTVKERSLTC